MPISAFETEPDTLNDNSIPITDYRPHKMSINNDSEK